MEDDSCRGESGGELNGDVDVSDDTPSISRGVVVEETEWPIADDVGPASKAVFERFASFALLNTKRDDLRGGSDIANAERIQSAGRSHA